MYIAIYVSSYYYYIIYIYRYIDLDIYICR